jgi:hypothetical protein
MEAKLTDRELDHRLRCTVIAQGWRIRKHPSDPRKFVLFDGDTGVPIAGERDGLTVEDALEICAGTRSPIG